MPRIRFNHSPLTPFEPEAGNRRPLVDGLAAQRQPAPRPDTGIRTRFIAPVAGKGWPIRIAGPAFGWRLPR